jgi:hypothetical protein
MLESLSFRNFFVATLLALTLTIAASAKSDPDYTQIGHSINVGPGQEVGEVTCIGCSIRIRGQVSGDATTVGGSIFIEDQGQVAGDVTAVAGSIRLDKTVKIAGDATAVGGEIRRAPEAQIAGDVTSVGGPAWVPLILIAPVLFLGLLVAFVVWLVNRSRRPVAPAGA